MAVFASEAFTASDGTNLTAGGNWTRGGWITSGDFLIASNRGYQSGGTQVDMYHSTAPGGADYSVSVDLHYLADATNAGGGVLGRVDTASGTGTYYMARINRVSATSGNWQLYKRVSGTFTQLGSNASQTVAAGNSYNLKLAMAGSSISVYDEGGGSPTIGPITDSSITAAGRPGLRGNVNTLSTSGYHFDNWQAEEASGGGTDLAHDNASHAHTADSLALTTSTALAIADAAHGHAAEQITLGTAGSAALIVADASHAHTAGAAPLSTASVLALADAQHAHAADAVALSVHSSLIVDQALHDHAAEMITLGVAGADTLSIGSAAHSHVAAALAITSASQLAVADALHSQAVDGLVLSAASVLALQDALHAHAADQPDLSDAPALLIADALHAHTSDGLQLVVDAWLLLQGATHGHAAGLVVLVPSGAQLVGTVGYAAALPGRSWKTAATAVQRVAKWGDR